MRKNILITGASAGLGRGMALEFAARGRNLALCARRLPLLESLKDELVTRHPGIQVAIRASTSMITATCSRRSASCATSSAASTGSS